MEMKNATPLVAGNNDKYCRAPVLGALHKTPFQQRPGEQLVSRYSRHSVPLEAQTYTAANRIGVVTITTQLS